MQGAQTRAVAPGSFRHAAFDALKVSEKPSEILHDREEPAPPNLRLQEILRNARPPPRPKLQLPRNSKTAFLYVRSSSFLGTGPREDSDSGFYVMKCPVCGRTAFTSLQGLLNHARISHSLEWGTHEECIRACAVTDPDIDVDAGIEVGVSSGGILPALRTIFEMAVGSSRPDNGTDRFVVEDEKSVNAGSDASGLNYLTKTLGLHEDTPALAPFLGKKPVHRGINVHQQDEILDVDGFAGSVMCHTVRPKNSWRLRLAQRSDACVTADEGPVGHEVPDSGPIFDHTGDDNTKDKRNAPSEAALGAVTRFHFTTRIVITDRSLWIDSGMLRIYKIYERTNECLLHDRQAKKCHSPTNGC